MRIGRQTERLPHVHDRQPNARTLPLAEPSVKLAHARLRAVLAAEPDRPTANKVTDHDPVAVAFADRNLVNPDHLRTRRAHALELSFHVLLVQRLDRVPVQRQFLRHVLDRRPSAPPPDKVGKALGIERIVREKLEPFSLHTATPATIDPPYLQFQKYPSVAARKITHPPNFPVEPRGTNTYPKVAACASLFVPSAIDAKSKPGRNAKYPRNAQLCQAFSPKITHSIPRRPLIRSEGVGFKLESPFNPTPESDVASWTIDLTLSSRFFIPKQRRFARLFAQAFDLAKGDA